METFFSLTYVFWSLEADPANGRPEATFRVAGEGEPLLQFALWAVIGGAAAAAQGRRQLCSINPARSLPARWPGGSCCRWGNPVLRVLVAPRQRVVVVGDGDACLMAFRSLAAHGGQRRQRCRRRRWPEQEHPQVTEQDATAALQHALAAQHQAVSGQKLTAPRKDAGRKQHALYASPSWANTSSYVVGWDGAGRGCVFQRLLGFKAAF